MQQDLSFKTGIKSFDNKSAWMLRQAATAKENADRLRRQQQPIAEQLQRFPNNQDLKDHFAKLERSIREYDKQAVRYLSHANV